MQLWHGPSLLCAVGVQKKKRKRGKNESDVRAAPSCCVGRARASLRARAHEDLMAGQVTRELSRRDDGARGSDGTGRGWRGGRPVSRNTRVCVRRHLAPSPPPFPFPFLPPPSSKQTQLCASRTLFGRLIIM